MKFSVASNMAFTVGRHQVKVASKIRIRIGPPFAFKCDCRVERALAFACRHNKLTKRSNFVNCSTSCDCAVPQQCRMRNVSCFCQNFLFVCIVHWSFDSKIQSMRTARDLNNEWENVWRLLIGYRMRKISAVQLFRMHIAEGQMARKCKTVCTVSKETHGKNEPKTKAKESR